MSCIVGMDKIKQTLPEEIIYSLASIGNGKSIHDCVNLLRILRSFLAKHQGDLSDSKPSCCSDQQFTPKVVFLNLGINYDMFLRIFGTGLPTLLLGSGQRLLI